MLAAVVVAAFQAGIGFKLVRRVIPGALLAWGGHRDTHGHEHVLILEVEAGRGVPGVDMWL